MQFIDVPLVGGRKLTLILGNSPITVVDQGHGDPYDCLCRLYDGNNEKGWMVTISRIELTERIKKITDY
jgi:hypothetical protein